MNSRSVVIHGHFYQPPRENPWTDEIPRQPSAAPYHDWNERIHDECYRAVVAARILDGRGRITRVMNALELMSWDAGPTLLRWMERERPDTYQGFLDADVASVTRVGHGGAMATPYHHVILPLASRREKVTEVRWGIADFERRFRRTPVGMWLPETAVDMETLEVLAQEGIAFTVLAPRQVEAAPEGGLPGRVDLGGGRSIAVFVYDGSVSHDVGFGSLLKDSARWTQRLAEASKGREVVAVATDGETFGHHHTWGDMALAATLQGVAAHPDLRLDNFASFLARHPPREDVTVVAPSSWSCSHGVDRWRRDCGCKSDPTRPTSQAWRAVLREALAELADALHVRFEREGRTLLLDPWAARDEYGTVLEGSSEERSAYLERHTAVPLDAAALSRSVALLEMERDVLRMDTSCAWFFDDIARLEPLQSLYYAAHALDLLGPGGQELEDTLVRRLAGAVSNDPAAGDGARLWRRKVRPASRGKVVTTPGADRAPPRGEEHRARVGSSAIAQAVARALRDPSRDTVEGALTAVDGADGADLFDVQTTLARALAEADDPDPHLVRLAERLEIAPDVVSS
jgi:alpha-amylase/alpha-mannosidase (GH57 family)